MPVEVVALVRDVARSLQPIAEERRVAVEVHGTSLDTMADPDKLRKVFENLVGNALKFTDAGGSIRVEITQEAKSVRVTVEDSGVGMASEDLKHVFDRFYRGREDRPGSGLGLSITRDLVRLHGGDVTARSAPGKGSTFSALLPMSAA